MNRQRHEWMRRAGTVGAVGAALIVLAGCGSGDGGNSTTTTSATTTSAARSTSGSTAPVTSAGSAAPATATSARATTTPAASTPAASENSGALEPRIDFAEATRIVLAEVPGGQITELKLDVVKGGTTVWEADLVDATGAAREVTIDAVNGRVLQNVPAR